MKGCYCVQCVLVNDDYLSMTRDKASTTENHRTMISKACRQHCVSNCVCNQLQMIEGKSTGGDGVFC